MALVVAYALQLLLHLSPVVDPRDRAGRSDPLAASLTGLAFGAGALLFGGHARRARRRPWPGLVGGLLVVGLAQRASVR